MVVMCYASGIISCGRRTSELSNAIRQANQAANGMEIFKVLRFKVLFTCA